MKEALSFSETSVLTRATRRNIPEDSILMALLFSRMEAAVIPNINKAIFSIENYFPYNFPPSTESGPPRGFTDPPQQWLLGSVPDR
jgi:hypothetical protein